MLEEDFRIVQTGIKATPKTNDIFNSVIGQMSDGIWENSPCMHSYWADADIDTIDNEIVIKVNARYSIMEKDYNYKGYKYVWRNNRYARMTDKEILKFYANKIRGIVKQEDNDNKKLSEMSDEEFHRYYNENCKKPERLDYGWRKDNQENASYLDYETGVTVADAYNVVKSLKEKIGK